MDINDLIAAHQAYWTENPDEKTALLDDFPERLSWGELLRLHHLNCMELVNEEPVRSAFMGEEPDVEPARTPAYELCQELLERLTSPASPYLSRASVVWQTNEDPDPERPPDMQGAVRNASLTHLGCLEIMRTTEEGFEVAFEALDVLQLLAMGEPALFRAARLFYDDGRPEERIVVPLLYGLSWFTADDHDRDGSITRFCCPVAMGDGYASVGIGHQDWVIAEDGELMLFGLGSVTQAVTALNLSDPRFDQRCRARGLNPADVRRQADGQ